MIDFYFDFSSPYGYLAATQIDTLAARYKQTVNWHPILLGAIFKSTGGAPLTQIPFKGDYSVNDFYRSARFYGVPLNMPTVFPISGVAASRATLWAKTQSVEAQKTLTHALFKSLYADNQDISNAETVVKIATTCGHDEQAVIAGMNDPAIKEALKQNVEAALTRKVFGSPFFFVDNEPFWGADRLPQIEHWLKTGGF